MHSTLGSRLKRYSSLYILILIPIIYYLVFLYYPILTQFILSFKDYRILGGIWGSEWVGWENYNELFSSAEFFRLIKNTITISLLRLIVGFFPPIILAIFLFDMSSSKLKRISQSIIYIPHFFSWVVLYAIVYALFSSKGYVNNIIQRLGFPSKEFLMSTKLFYPMLIGSALWKELGWGTIIYLAALTSVDPELFEAAKIDGAGPFRRIWHITLPGILPVIVFVLTISLGNIMKNAGVEQILLFYSPATYEVGDVIGTWVFRRGLGEMKYSLSAGMAQFNSLIGLVMVLIFNKLANKYAGVGIW